MTHLRSYEIGPIRPPSEARSLFLRISRNCSWNKCAFCPVYKGQKFSRRSKEEILEDFQTIKDIAADLKAISWQLGLAGSMQNSVVSHLEKRAEFSSDGIFNVALWLASGGGHVFLQDANALIMDSQELASIIQEIKKAFPKVDRITTYARSATVARKSVEELRCLKEAGLTRVHIGLESGHDPLLTFMKKGTTSEKAIEAGRKVKEAGLSLSEYVILGMGGKELWKEHAEDTARVLNAIDPNFIRLRTLSVVPGCPLQEDLQSGDFTLLSSEELAREEQLLIQGLEGISSTIVSDHITNLFQEIEGKLPETKEAMLAVLDRFFSLSEEDKINYIVGRRVAVLGRGYNCLDDMDDPDLYNRVQTVVENFRQQGEGDIEKTLQQFMQQMV